MSTRSQAFLGLFALCSSFTATGLAVAEPAPPSASLETTAHVATGAEARPERRWYGWQTLTLDAASFGAIGSGAALFSAQGSRETLPPQILLWSGLGGSMMGAPIVHFSHGNVGRGFGSLGLRLSGLCVVSLAGQEIGGSSSEGVAAFGLALLASAIVLDATAFDDVAAPRPSIARWSLSPMLGSHRGILFRYRV